MRTIHDISAKTQTRRKLRKSSTPQEIILWSKIKNSNLGYKFRRQHSIGKYIVDFYCAKKKLIIEVDGSQHIEKQKEYDLKKDLFFQKLGFRVLRFMDNEINNNLEGVLMKIIFELK
ncbi:endonuclease domain-containing protein [Patescibacteria group bacterium]|nr:endonuclease domain-containing protein [Patescibacteria group bacterium]